MNLANTVTLLRILPLVVILFLLNRRGIPGRLVGGALIVLLTITDVLDGMIAWKYKTLLGSALEIGIDRAIEIVLRFV